MIPVELRSLAPLAALTALLVPSGGGALPVLSEVFYDATGSDDGLVFVELFGEPGTSVDGLVLEGVNGSNGASTGVVALTGIIPADGILVVADEADGGGTGVAEADLVVDFDFQNGPDSILLREEGGVVLDAVGYGVFDAGDVFAGEGSPAPDASAGESLARLFADLDTDDNAADWHVLDAPTPGMAPLQAVPEPGSSLLFGVGVAALAAARRRAA